MRRDNASRQGRLWYAGTLHGCARRIAAVFLINIVNGPRRGKPCRRQTHGRCCRDEGGGDIGIAESPTVDGWSGRRDPLRGLAAGPALRLDEQRCGHHVVYINGKNGIAPKDQTHPGYAKIQLPLLTALLPWSDVLLGKENSLIDWWNGGRLEIFDDAATIASQYDADTAQKPPYGVLVPDPKIAGNPIVKCVEGDCSDLKMIATNGEFANSAPFQLTEFTFGSAITGDQTKPYGWVPADIGYNLSMVDSTYLPAVMEPLNNPEIPYIGSVMSPEAFRKKMTQWLADHDGWPIYKDSTKAHPKIPQAFPIFADAFKTWVDKVEPSNPFNFVNIDPKNAGKPILNMINLYLKCRGASSDPPDSTCGKIYKLEQNLFGPNLKKYMTYPCAVFQDPPGTGDILPFPDTIGWRLRTLYGWVPYNFTFVASNPCGATFDGNPLVGTVGKDNYPQYADSYRLDPGGLQYNYLNETDKTQWFNPYVELLHSPNYLNMKSYAFSIDDAVGFQQHKGEGLIYAVGGTDGLQNKNELKPNEIVNVAFGYAKDGTTYLWQSSQYVCKDQQLHPPVDLTGFPSYDFFPLNSGGYPCRLGALLSNNKVYYFDITQGPPNLKIDCNQITDLIVKDWCGGITVKGLDRTPLHLDHIIGPAVTVK